ncbi:MAG: hypothetical protein IPN76_04005 [Saprospiraceae bacterium]|nr:hypothetical protein [Saprospiraceae bacterium]
MPRYKLFRIFETLSKPERAEAEKHVASTKHSDCIKLYSQLKKMTTEMMVSANAKQELFKSSFPGLAYDETRMRKLMTYLTQFLEDYLVQKELATDTATRQHLLACSLSRRSDYGLFKESVEHRLQALEAGKARGTNYFKEKAHLLQALYFHPETPKYGTVPDYFSIANENKEWHLVLNRLLAGAESLARKRTLGREDAHLFFDAAAEAARKQGADCPPVGSLFLRLADLLQSREKEVDLPQLKAQLLAVFDLMERQEQQMAIKLLILYATPFSNNGDMRHSRFVFDMYRFGLERQLMQHGKNAIETILFTNVAFIGALVGELEWTDDFIKNYGPCLPKEDRLNAIHLCQAAWHYNNGLKNDDPTEFDIAMKQLSLIPTRADEKFDLRMRSLQLRIQYDTFRAGLLTVDELMEQARTWAAT